MVAVHIRSRPPLTLRPNKLLGRQNFEFQHPEIVRLLQYSGRPSITDSKIRLKTVHAVDRSGVTDKITSPHSQHGLNGIRLIRCWAAIKT